MKEKTISEVFSKYRKLGYKGWQQDAQREWKNYKQNKYDSKIAMIYSMDLVDPKIREWAKIRINKEIKDSGIYHVDGYRIGRIGSKTAMKRFRREFLGCGNLEFIDTCPIDGKQYALGCSWGF